MKPSRPLRVFFGFHEVAGVYGNLCAGLEACGCKSRAVFLSKHPFNYRLPYEGRLGALIRRWGHKTMRTDGQSWPAYLPRWVVSALGQVAVLLAALKHDVFVFGSGQTFADVFGPRSVWPLKMLRRQTVHLYLGSDSRAPYCDRFGFEQQGRMLTVTQLQSMVLKNATRVRASDKNADIVIDSPCSTHFHTRPFASFCWLGNAVTPLETAAPAEDGAGEEIRILHCPSNPAFKGSVEIRSVIEKLQREGQRIRYTELVGVDNSTVLRAIQESDFVIDQLYSDMPMPTFPREAATCKKAAIIGSYGWKDLMASVPSEMWPPIIPCHPDALETCLREFISRGREGWKAAGEAAHAFVLQNWTTERCAARLLQLLDGDAPAEAWVNPQRGSYVWGCGMHAVEVIEIAKTLHETGGAEAFMLPSGSPLLEATLRLTRFPDMADETHTQMLDDAAEAGGGRLVQKLLDRNAELQARLAALEKKSEEKISNLQSMIERRDVRITKLEKKLGITSEPESGKKAG